MKQHLSSLGLALALMLIVSLSIALASSRRENAALRHEVLYLSDWVNHLQPQTKLAPVHVQSYIQREDVPFEAARLEAEIESLAAELEALEAKLKGKKFQLGVVRFPHLF